MTRLNWDRVNRENRERRRVGRDSRGVRYDGHRYNRGFSSQGTFVDVSDIPLFPHRLGVSLGRSVVEQVRSPLAAVVSTGHPGITVTPDRLRAGVLESLVVGVRDLSLEPGTSIEVAVKTEQGVLVIPVVVGPARGWLRLWLRIRSCLYRWRSLR
jgi:hypothetical protein